MPAQGVRVGFINLPNTQLEIIEPLGEKSPIINFLEKNPKGGQHHVCFEVPDIHEAKAEMEKKGAKVLGEPRIGAHGTMVIFIHPKDSDGVLIELMETPKRPALGFRPMGIFEGIVVFVCSWWLIFLPILSAGTRSQHEAGTVIPGTERGAPERISWRWKFIAPTIGAAADHFLFCGWRSICTGWIS